MQVSICNRDSLLAISPAALAAYAGDAGWNREASYRVHSDVYAGRALPEIIIPRTEHLGDYATVVSTLIEAFAEVAGQDEMSVQRCLATADRDVVRVRAAESDDGSVTLNDGVDLIGGARGLLLLAACSLREPQPVYRAGANRRLVGSNSAGGDSGSRRSFRPGGCGPPARGGAFSPRAGTPTGSASSIVSCGS